MSDDPYSISIPLTPQSLQGLLLARPKNWQYLYWADVLWKGRSALEWKWVHHIGRLGLNTGSNVGSRDVSAFVQAATAEVQQSLSALSRELNADTIGLMVSSNDPRRIEQLGHQILAFYERLMDFSARTRGTVVPNNCGDLREVVAQLVDRPLLQTREFIDNFVISVTRFTGQGRAAGDLNLRLNLTIDSDTTERLVREVESILTRRK